MKDVDYMSVAEDTIKKLNEGAFLTVKSGDKLNTMTIGWATFGVFWTIPIMMVAVRSSRHTFEITKRPRILQLLSRQETCARRLLFADRNPAGTWTSLRSATSK